jgi:hypothetical protein
MPSPEPHDLAALLRRIHDLAAGAETGSPDTMREALNAIAVLATRPGGDTPEMSDIPRTENQSL